MRPVEVTQRSVVVLLSLTILTCQGRGQAKSNAINSQDKAARALARYIQLRLQDANWKEYSKFITWPDEPSWDCKWVASKDTFGAPVKRGQEIIIPVVYSRLGLYCYGFHFKSEPKLVTVQYELVKRQGGWKVSSPIPDYPEINSDVLVRSLSATANNASETPEHRAEAAKSVSEIREALKPGRKTLPQPKSELSHAGMNPLHFPRNKFTHVLGIDLMQDKLDQVLAKLGKSPVFTSGDASEYVGRTCYRLGDGGATIEFNEWEMGAGCVLRYTKGTDYADCALLKGQRAKGHLEINGLKLGMNKREVLKILGKPTKKTLNKWTYDLYGTANGNTPLDRSIYRARDFEDGYPYYWQFLIVVGFKGPAVSRLELSPSVQQ